MRSSQRGMTLIGFIIVLTVAGVFAYVGMKLFPMYSEYYAVVSAMKALQAEPNVGKMSPEQIRQLLSRKFNISYVDSVKRDNISLVREGPGYNLTIAYEVRREMIYNLDVVGKFQNTVQLGN